MDGKEKIKEYLVDPINRVMTLTTARDNQPWAAPVYYVIDDEFNLYWASWPERRHSREIDANSKVAASIIVEAELPVAQVQVQGDAEILEPGENLRPFAETYAKKFDMSDGWINKVIAGETHHRMYRLKPLLYVLFDEANFEGEQARQEFTSIK